VGASKLLESGVEVHLAFLVKQDLNGPPALAAAVFQQVNGGNALSVRLLEMP
jgi:2-keto-4-pentenoate hydratase